MCYNFWVDGWFGCRGCCFRWLNRGGRCWFFFYSKFFCMFFVLKYYLLFVGDRVFKLLVKSFVSCGKFILNEGGDVFVENNIFWSYGCCYYLIEVFS